MDNPEFFGVHTPMDHRKNATHCTPSRTQMAEKTCVFDQVQRYRMREFASWKPDTRLVKLRESAL